MRSRRQPRHDAGSRSSATSCCRRRCSGSGRRCVSQIVIVMLGSAVVLADRGGGSDLSPPTSSSRATSAPSRPTSSPRRSIWCWRSLLRQLLRLARLRGCSARRADAMIEFTTLGHPAQPAARGALDRAAVARSPSSAAASSGWLLLFLRIAQAAACAALRVGLHRAVPGHAAADAAVPGLLRPVAVRHQRAALARRRRRR